MQPRSHRGGSGPCRGRARCARAAASGRKGGGWEWSGRAHAVGLRWALGRGEDAGMRQACSTSARRGSTSEAARSGGMAARRTSRSEATSSSGECCSSLSNSPAGVPKHSRSGAGTAVGCGFDPAGCHLPGSKRAASSTSCKGSSARAPTRCCGAKKASSSGMRR
eukprot:3794711-Prymnesium_polylepis.2